MMPELGFGPDDNDRLVASYSGGWQMRMCLGKILLKVGGGQRIESLPLLHRHSIAGMRVDAAQQPAGSRSIGLLRPAACVLRSAGYTCCGCARLALCTEPASAAASTPCPPRPGPRPAAAG